MDEPFHFEYSAPFEPERSAEILRAIPTEPGVFALYGHDAADGRPSQPYLTRAADLRRRITRILAPPDASADGTPAQSKRLNLRERVALIAYTVTGSEFESTLTLYHASTGIFGIDEARRRLKLRTPYCLQFTAQNAHPRVYSTNRLGKRTLSSTYGPFPSRAAADRYCDAVLDLFKLRRCYEDLVPAPDHPGCVYGEMKKCLAPCNQAHTPEGAAAYSAEAAAVKRFFDTRGESMVVAIGLEREEASAAMEFEKAAELHTQWHKVKAAQALADELVQPIPKLRAILVQPAAKPLGATQPALSPAKGLASETWDSETRRDDATAAVFLLQAGSLVGPARLSTLGVRAVKEQTSVGSSLFAQPLMLQAVPLNESPTLGAPEPALSPPKGPVSGTLVQTPAESPEVRAAVLIAGLEAQASAPTDLATLSDHLSLLRRWYYRPEKQRKGEAFFPDANGQWPIRRILRGAARMALGEPAPMAETQRELAQRNPNPGDIEDALEIPVRTKILHKGRPDVERVVHIIDPPPPPPTFTSRRRSR